MRKPIRCLLMIAFAITAFGSQAQTFPTTSWADDTDTSWYDAEQNEFTLTTAQELAGVALLVTEGNDFSGKTILLNNDIDLDGNLWIPIGRDMDFPFSGTFNGNNYLVDHLWINRPDDNFAGLFGNCVGGSITNLRLDNATVRGFDNTGSLAGNMTNESSVDSCYAYNVDVYSMGCSVGGLVGGLVTDGAISHSSAQGEVFGVCQVGGLVGALYNKTDITESYANCSVSGVYLVGGFVGTSILAFFNPDRINTIIDSYARGSATAQSERAGGFLGGGSSFVVRNAYSTGAVSAPEYEGGFIGSVGGGVAENDFFDTETSGTTEGIGGFEGGPIVLGISAKTTTEMKSQDLVDLLNSGDPEGPWAIVAGLNDDYPALAGGPLSVRDGLLPAHSVKVYPTVFTGFFTVECDRPMRGYEIYDLSGTLLEVDRLNAESAEIAPRALASGMYVLRIYTQSGVLSKKVIKK